MHIPQDSTLLRIVACFILLLCAPTCQLAQMQPASAHVNLYFPQLIDGGPSSQKWQTTFAFVNTGNSTANVSLFLLSESGGPLSLDLGSGALSRHDFVVPPNGARTLRSRVASESLVVGWAFADSDVPVQATAAFRMIVNGAPLQEITAEPTLPTLVYTSAANRFLGVALANVNPEKSVTVRMGVSGANGEILGAPVDVTIPAAGHTMFNLWQKFPGLQNMDFSGVLKISATDPMPDNEFIAWTLNGDASGTLSALPPGGLAWPISHFDRIWLVYSRVVDSARQIGAITWPVRLQIFSPREVNAYARGGSEIGIYIGLSELISDSPSELAYVIGHELGHLYQQHTGLLDWDRTNREFDADCWGAFLGLASGFDPYGAAGALAKLAMATGRAGLSQAFEDQLASDAHKSFNERINTVYDSFVKACGDPEIASACQQYKNIIHPHLPSTAPLIHDRTRLRTERH